MRRMIYLLPLVFLLLSCQKEETQVVYQITESASGFQVNYRGADGSLIKKDITTSSAEEVWRYSFTADEGDIVFVSAIYNDISSAIDVKILIDGKVYKQGSSTQDTIKYVTVSGTVPF